MGVTESGVRVTDRLRTMAAPVALLALLVALPLAAGQYVGGIVTEILIFSIFAISLNLLIGYTGLLSFGHAAFFALGAYTEILLAIHFGVSAWLGMVAGIAAAAAGAAAIGYFCIRVTGISFVMLTLAFSQLVFTLADKWRDVTGGSDGVGGLSRPSFFGFDMAEPLNVYYLALAGFVLSYWTIARLVASPLGHTFVGIRENESRMRAIGYPVQRYKLLSFTIGGLFAGLSGGIYAIFNGFISPDAAHWSASGEVLIMVILGGVGTLVGPAVGAALFLVLKNLVSSHADYWLMIVGTIFILCVVFFRSGVWGAARNLFMVWRGG
jgi:branched-chain amino acid transport system permease protein